MTIEYSLEQIAEAAAGILDGSRSKILCFYGSMGAGKTTLIKELVKALGGEDEASSPTFGIVNEYEHSSGTTLAFHFDLYRLDSPEEALDMGIEEYFDQDVWVFIEWPEQAAEILPPQRTDIHLEITGPESRKAILSNR